MSDIGTFYERNAAFAEGFSQGDLIIKPRIMTIMLTCVDARVDPAHFAGLELGDALVLRNVGARVTESVILEVSILFNLMKLGTGGVAPTMGFAIVHHTDCGMAKFAVPQVAEAITEIFGSGDVVDTYAIADPVEAIKDDVAAAKAGVPDGIGVSGHLYDVTTGQLAEMVPLTSKP